MLTKTSISAVRALCYVGLQCTDDAMSPRAIAEYLGESPSYLAKVVRHLVKAGILRAHRGAAGGVTLARRPAEITLLDVVEACQGQILPDFCQKTPDIGQTCAFHQAGAELHDAITGVLQRWTLAHLLEKPRPSPGLLALGVKCRLLPEPVSVAAAASPAPNGAPAPATKREP